MNLAHADVHIHSMMRAYKLKGQWRGEMTVLRALDGREYSWPRLLSMRERMIVARDIGSMGRTQPLGSALDARGPVVEIWFNGQWRSRSVDMLEGRSPDARAL